MTNLILNLLTNENLILNYELLTLTISYLICFTLLQTKTKATRPKHVDCYSFIILDCEIFGTAVFYRFSYFIYIHLITKTRNVNQILR